MVKGRVEEKGISPAIIIIPVAFGLAGLALIALVSMAKGAVTPPPAGKATLYGKVTDYNTGSPLAGVALTLDSAQTSTDSGGNYTFSDVALGSYTLTLTKSGYISITESIDLPEGLTELNITMVPVTAPGAPKFYMNPVVEFTVEDGTWMGMYWHYRFSHIIENDGTVAGTYDITHEILVNGVELFERVKRTITIGPGATYEWSREIDIDWRRIGYVKVSLTGTWEKDNYAEVTVRMP